MFLPKRKPQVDLKKGLVGCVLVCVGFFLVVWLVGFFFFPTIVAQSLPIEVIRPE